MRSMRVRIAAALATVTVLAGSVVAYAAWSASTSGQGEAVDTVAQAITISPLGTGTATMYPGGPAATIYFSASNPNPYAVNFTGAAYSSPVSTSTTSCASANLSISPSAPTTVSISRAAGASNVQLSIPGVLQLAHSAPDGCQGVGALVSVSLTGSEA